MKRSTFGLCLGYGLIFFSCVVMASGNLIIASILFLFMMITSYLTAWALYWFCEWLDGEEDN